MNTRTFNVPNGIVDDQTRITEVEMRELDGNDEDFLRTQEEVKKTDGGNIITRLMQRCIVSIGQVTDKKMAEALYYERMPLADQSFLFIKLREWSIDKIYTYSISCPSCNKIQEFRTDLSELPVDQQKEEYWNKDTFIEAINGTLVTFRRLYVRDERALDAVRRMYPKDISTRELMLQIKDIGGNGPPTPQMLKAWSWNSRNKLRQVVERVTAGIDMELEMTCIECKHSWKGTMPVEPRSFFFPGEATVEAPMAKPYRSSGRTQASLQTDADGVQETFETYQSKSASST